MRISAFTPLLLTTLSFISCSPESSEVTNQEPVTLESFIEQGKKTGNPVTLVSVPRSVEEVQQRTTAIVEQLQQDGDALAGLSEGDITFDSTILAMDRMSCDLDLDISEIVVAKNVSTDPEVRKEATNSLKVLSEALVEFQFREDIYLVFKQYADSKPKLDPESVRLLDKTMLEYKRSGFHLSAAERKEIESKIKQLSILSVDFRTNITETSAPVAFSPDELKGLPEAFLSGLEKGSDGNVTLHANVTHHYTTLMNNADSEATRKKFFYTRYNLTRDLNIPLLTKIVNLRHEVANDLGYSTWSDYKTEVLMSGTAQVVEDFLVDLKTGLQPKFEQEVETLTALKAERTGDSSAQLNIWDFRYYSNELKDEKYNINEEQLKRFFPYEQTLEGMFDIYEEVFAVRIEQVENPEPWADGVTLHTVTDLKSNEPLGMFYLDMFPRSGKYNHFAQFGIVPGRRIDDATYQRPTVALVCNFPPKTGEEPSLLSYRHVETLFHEFGHAMHSILSQSRYFRFVGTSVPRDFVEAPSQVLEYWVSEKAILDRYATDYEDSTKKIPESVLAQIETAEKALIGTFYRRQLAFGILDQHMHTRGGFTEEQLVADTNNIIGDVFLPVPDDTAFVAFFGHMMGYDAGYYGYAWADVIAADMASIFENAPGGFMDRDAGMSLRKHIFEPGDSRDVNESIKAFLGRPTSQQPFLEKLGIAD
ncbi:MAG: M3 family metallopeptidase [Verrucomicrobiota bacterium]